MDEDDRLRQSRHASLSLSTFARPFVAAGGGFFRLLWRMMQALMRKLSFNTGTQIEMPERAPARLADASIEVTSSEGQLPEHAQEVVAVAARDLSAAVAQVAQGAPNQELLRAPTASAYVAMNLQEIGGLLVDSRNDLLDIDRQMNEAAGLMAHSCGSTVSSMRQYLVGMDFSDPGLLRQVPQETRELVQRHAQCSSDLCRAQLQFCAFAIEALKASRECGDTALERSTKTKVMQFADTEMAGLIFNTSSSQKSQDVLKSADQPTSSDIESKNRISSPAPPAEDKKDAQPSYRSRWAGVTAGDFSDPEEDASPEIRAPRRRP